MLDLNGDLPEAIDDMVNEQTGARFVGGLRNVGSSFKNQLKVMTAAIGDLYGAEADEVFGLLRLFALGKVLNIAAIEALADEFIEEFPVKTINVAAAAVTTTTTVRTTMQDTISISWEGPMRYERCCA